MVSASDNFCLELILLISPLALLWIDSNVKMFFSQNT